MIRLSEKADGPAIRALVVASGQMAEGLAFSLDWSDISGLWLVEETGGKVRGTIQVCFGRPTSRLENLSVDPHLDGRTRARIVRDIDEAARALCKQLGASAARAFVPFRDKSIKKNMKKRGWSITDQGNVVLKVL